MAKRPTLTTSAGTPAGDNQNSVAEKLARQNRERIPVQSRTETWKDTAILAGGVIAIVAICASVLAGFHARHHSIHANAPAVTDTGSAAPRSG